MTKLKQRSYEAPITEALELRVEGVICQSNPVTLMLFTDFGSANAAGSDIIEDAGYDL